MQIQLTLKEMRNAIEKWDTLKESKEGYNYLVSGISLEMHKEDFATLKKAQGHVYCHLGIHNEALVFIFASETDTRSLVEATTFAVPFYNSSSNNSADFDNSIISESTAGKQILR